MEKKVCKKCGRNIKEEDSLFCEDCSYGEFEDNFEEDF